MTKHCVICGASFSAPPSSKKITCSKACSAKRKAQTHTAKHNIWSETSRTDWSARKKAIGFDANARRGIAVANALPESQRGPQHRAAKVWTLIDPDGHEIVVTNLIDWARKHIDLFELGAEPSERERLASNISAGFRQIALSRAGKRKNPISTYKGWRLEDVHDKIKK